MPVRIAIEGNIAAGKSTFLRILAEAGLGFFVVPEPLSKWQGIPADDDVEMPVSASQDAGMNILDKFYSDQERWAFTFQTYAFLSRLRAQLRPFEDYETKPELRAAGAGSFKAKTAKEEEGESAAAAAGGKRSRDGESADAAGETSSKRTRDDKAADAGSAGNGSGAAASGKAEAAAEEEKILFFERSVLSDKYCFAANCRESGLFEELEWRVYCDWWKFIMQEFKALRIDGLVYLRCAPATCHQRLHKRARDEEAGVPLSYLNDLHHRHEEWLVSRTCGREFPITTLVLDTDAEFETDPVRRTAMVDRIRAFVASLASQNGTHIAPSIAPTASNGSGGAAAAGPDESSAGAGLGPRISSRDGTVLMGEIDGLTVMRVGPDGKPLPAAAAAAGSDEDEDGVPSGPVQSAPADADADDSGSDADDGQEAAASSARAPGKAAGKKGKGGITAFFGKKSA
ncbi:hypothetical protein FNF27_07882 [Cafeteria roenbergensis]|uniref:Deoxynucleoside kinase domain-containing protein n=1 Tax=Cafeteria roenbergensis TaxID=33653 RepID=A0A5A8DGI5_CAFRO|nr:hypothetical protein FNF27_07882 [Cafeteria roenbergensis]